MNLELGYCPWEHRNTPRQTFLNKSLLPTSKALRDSQEKTGKEKYKQNFWPHLITNLRHKLASLRLGDVLLGLGLEFLNSWLRNEKLDSKWSLKISFFSVARQRQDDIWRNAEGWVSTFLPASSYGAHSLLSWRPHVPVSQVGLCFHGPALKLGPWEELLNRRGSWCKTLVISFSGLPWAL